MATIDTIDSKILQYAGLLAVELDPQYSDPVGEPPKPLTVAAATALAGHLAKDLDLILGGIAHLGLILTGALYDQTEILKPGLPVTSALADLYRGSNGGKPFTPRLIALGTDHGDFPITAINPLRRPGLEPLLLLPFCFVGTDDDIAALARVMEDSLLQNGAVSAATSEAVQRAFGVTALNLSFATISDLCALLRVQLESNGFLQLWELLEHAWFERSGTRCAMLDTDNCFLVAENHAHTAFYTFDDWAQFGPGRALPSAELGRSYLDWARTQRQYTLGLQAYGLHVRPVLANPGLVQTLSNADDAALLAAFREIPCLSGDYLVERIFHNDNEQPERKLLITHQADSELGTLAYTVTTLDAAGQLLRLEHHYPLQPQGTSIIVNQLIQRCAEQGAERQVLHPGRILYSETGRSLRSATVTDLPAPTVKTH